MNAAAPRAVPVPAGQGRAGYLREVSALLWPPPASVTVSRAGLRAAAAPCASEFIVLPGLSRPRLLVPPAARPAAAAVRRYGEPGARATRLATRALSLALATGLGGAVLRGRVRVHAPPGADTIESYLAGALGHDVLVSMHLGEARANRKPVLQLLTPRGGPAGFAKIGINPLTCGLVRAERDALGRLGRARLAGLTVPEVLHYGQWRGLDVLVLGALPVWLRRRPVRWPRLAAAMSEIAGVDGLRRAPLAGSSYWRRLTSRLAAADPGAGRSALAAALGSLPAGSRQAAGLRRVARRLDAVEHGQYRPRAAGLGLGALHPRCAARLRRAALLAANRGRAGPRRAQGGGGRLYRPRAAAARALRGRPGGCPAYGYPVPS